MHRGIESVIFIALDITAKFTDSQFTENRSLKAKPNIFVSEASSPVLTKKRNAQRR